MAVEFHGEITLKVQSLDILESLPELRFDEIIGDKNCDLNSKAIIQQSCPQRKHHTTTLICKAGTSPLDEEHVILLNDAMYFCLGKYVCKWHIEHAKLEWAKKLDPDACFSVKLMPDETSLLVHSEMYLSRIDVTGKMLWQFSGADILVTPSGQDGVEIIGDHIHVTDWNNTRYTLDFDGNLVSEQRLRF